MLVEQGFEPKDCTHWGQFFRSGAIAIRNDRQFRFHRSKINGVGGVDFWEVECLSADCKSVLAFFPLKTWAEQL
jgi:hypothetical protein